MPYKDPAKAKASARQRYLKNREEILSAAKVRYEEKRDELIAAQMLRQQQNRQGYLEYQRGYAQANKERNTDRKREWRNSNQDRAREQNTRSSRNWRIENRARYNSIQRVRNARMKPPMWSVAEDIEAFYKQAAELTKETGVAHEVDHIIPLRGKNVCGLHVAQNLRVVTAETNRKKANLLLDGGIQN